MSRPTTKADMALIWHALMALKAKSPASQMQWSHVETACDYIWNATMHGRAMIVDEAFLLLYDVGSPWYSQHSFLLEELVLRIAPGGNPASVVDEVIRLKEQHGCVAAVVGDSQIGAMTPYYIAGGFKVNGTQLIKA